MTKEMNKIALNNTPTNGKCPNCGKSMDRIGYYCYKCIGNSKMRLKKRDKNIPA